LLEEETIDGQAVVRLVQQGLSESPAGAAKQVTRRGSGTACRAVNPGCGTRQRPPTNRLR
jgi:hypothetical protein